MARRAPSITTLLTILLLATAAVFFGLTIARVAKKRTPVIPASFSEPPKLPHRPSPLAARADAVASAEKGTVVLDPRDPAAYRAGHLPGAVAAPAESLAAAADPAAALGLLGLTGREPLVIAADTSSLADAGRLFWLLESAGAESVHVLDGGLEAWTASGRSLESAAAPRPAAVWGKRADASRAAATAYVRDNYGRAGIEILDARGETIWGRPDVVDAVQWGRAGHIPHSLPLAPRDLLGEHALFLDVASALSILVKSGPRPASPLDAGSEYVAYDDGSSGQAALLYMLLRIAGIDRMRVDTGGWAAWAADSTLPVVRIASLDEMGRIVSAESGPADTQVRSVVFLDVRNDSDHLMAHIPGSLCLPAHLFADSLETVLARSYPGIDREHTALWTYCYGPDCIRSRNCATLAARDGFRVLVWFRGGMEEWQRAGKAVISKDASS